MLYNNSHRKFTQIQIGITVDNVNMILLSFVSRRLVVLKRYGGQVSFIQVFLVKNKGAFLIRR